MTARKPRTTDPLAWRVYFEATFPHRVIARTPAAGGTFRPERWAPASGKQFAYLPSGELATWYFETAADAQEFRAAARLT